jgi:hypothetical protein
VEVGVEEGAEEKLKLKGGRGGGCVVTAAAAVAVAVVVVVAGCGRAQEESAPERERESYGYRARAEIGCTAAQGQGGRGRAAGAAHESEQELNGEEYDRDSLEVPPRELPGATILLGEHRVYRDLRRWFRVGERARGCEGARLRVERVGWRRLRGWCEGGWRGGRGSAH